MLHSGFPALLSGNDLIGIFLFHPTILTGIFLFFISISVGIFSAFMLQFLSRRGLNVYYPRNRQKEHYQIIDLLLAGNVEGAAGIGWLPSGPLTA